MSLFKAHTSANESNAKQAMVASLRITIGKYIIAQEVLSQVLTGGDPEDCNVCKINKLTKIMSKLEGQVGQITKSYELLFGEEPPIKQVTREACKEHYPVLYKLAKEKGKKSSCSSSSSSSTSWPSSSSKGNSSSSSFDEKESSIKSAIVSAISKATGTPIEEIHINGGLINKESLLKINPSDFQSFDEYLNAVKATATPWDESDDRTGEEILSDSVIKTAEAECSSSTSASKPSKRTPKTNA